MTTIAANYFCMAADSLVDDDATGYRTEKIFVIDGCIVGAAGFVDDTTRFMDWFKAGRPDGGPEMRRDSNGESSFSALVLSKDGLFYFAGCCPPDRIIDPFFALGGGAQAALAAMHLGCDPVKAVEVACEIHSGSGGPVKVISLESITKRRQRERR